eukprot:738605-Prymnesium_polylepis.1
MHREDHQLRTAACIVSGRSMFLIWPAGGGKSLAAYLDGKASPGKVIPVVLPLRSPTQHGYRNSLQCKTFDT